MRKFPGESVIETQALLGCEEKFPARLVAYRLPDEVVNERLRKARKAAGKKGRSITKKTANWLRFGFYVTSVDENDWPAEVIGTIYRIRWRVELIFKSWKSLLGHRRVEGNPSGKNQMLRLRSPHSDRDNDGSLRLRLVVRVFEVRQGNKRTQVLQLAQKA